MVAKQQALWKLHKKLQRGERHSVESKSDYLVFTLDNDLLFGFFVVNMAALQIVLLVIAGGVSMHILTIPTFRKPRV